MKTQNKFWWFVLVAVSVTGAVLSTILIIFWKQLPPDQKQLLLTIFKNDFAYFFMAGILLFAGFGFTMDWFFRFYIVPINQLAEALQLKSTVNPEHTIDISGSFDVVRLAEMIDSQIAKCSPESEGAGQKKLSERITVESEREILAALLEGLPQGIVVCNLDARIVFYNRKAKAVLARHGSPNANRIGLGRSIYGVLDASLVKRALERIALKLDANASTASERFLIAVPDQQAIPADLLAVLDSQHHLSGFIIYIENAQTQLIREQKTIDKFQTWQQQMTQSISIIKSTAEVLEESGAIQQSRELSELVDVLTREAASAARTLTSEDVLHRLRPNQPLPLTPVNAEEWCHYIRHRAGESLGIPIVVKASAPEALISIDMHHLGNALLYVLAQIQTKTGCETVYGNLYQQDAWIYFDFSWSGKGLDSDSLDNWKSAFPVVGDVVLDITLGDILTCHGAKLWRLRSRAVDHDSGVRMLLPAYEQADGMTDDGHMAILPDSRPEFYDFNLFQQAGQSQVVDESALDSISYTVFDTETTGLDPHGGDEIISIGAVRIVNGRLLKEERYDQLINPQRHLPWASIKVHGIRPEMLADQPTIEQVLPSFFEFCHDTVMVGHNVAFDMRMLQLKEAATGVKFVNPILDTMLLSSVVHPAQRDHSLSAIARRLGIEIVGRHTALGDALATAQILLRMIPLLKDNGIRTLRQARQASEKTFYARLKY